MMNGEVYLLLVPAAIYLLGVCLALVDRKAPGRAPHVVAILGSLAGCGIALRVLLGNETLELAGFSVTPFATIAFRLDPLAAFFLLVISLVAAAASLYALGYLHGEHGSVLALASAYNGFLAAMVLVVVADTAFTFLFAWELMSLASFFLVVHDHRQEAVRRAGFIYLVMAHLSAAFLLVGFFLLGGMAGSLDFAAFRAGAGSLPEQVGNFVFLLALVGFGTKAGMVPLHIWLPRAHPAAPSHVSALMSGVMIKMAIYGLLRVAWEFAGPGELWWGGLILGLGAASAVLGVLYALMEHDLKRLLAFHSVENIGIILMGLGAAFLLMPLGQPAAAALALLASLYHVLNHAVFKALLFLGAGAVQKATHTRDLESLGGLIHRMPWTAVAFLVGSAAISALPPLNGFVSEWLTFQGLLELAGAATSPVVAVGAAVAAGLLALTGGLAVFCFVKAFGIAFLGMPRSEAARSAIEVGWEMRVGMVGLTVLCVVLGLAPTAVARLLSPVTSALTGVAVQPSLGLLPLPLTAHAGALAPLPLLAVIVVLGGVGLVLARAIGGPGVTRLAPPWGCGIVVESSMQYTAMALAKPIRIIFRALVRPYRVIERAHHGTPVYFVTSVRYEAGLHPVYEQWLYGPVVKAILALAHHVRRLQTGSLRIYLAYMFATLVVVLLLAR